MWSPLARRFFRSTFVGVIVSVTTLGTVGRPVDNFVGSPQAQQMLLYQRPQGLQRPCTLRSSVKFRQLPRKAVRGYDP